MFAITCNVNQSTVVEILTCNKHVVEYHVAMETIVQDAVLIPLRKEAPMVYNWYSKAGAMRSLASLIPAGGSCN
jgi:hypothetical protein